MNYNPLYSIVLFTLSKDSSNEARNGLTTMLSEIGYIEEGDQSTMILTDHSKQIKGTPFLNKLNDLARKIKFHEGDVVTLINSGPLTFLNGDPKRNNLSELIPVMRRFRFQYNSSSNTFVKR